MLCHGPIHSPTHSPAHPHHFLHLLVQCDDLQTPLEAAQTSLRETARYEDLAQLPLHWCRKTEGVSQPSVVRCVHCPNHGMQIYSVRLKSPGAVIMKANQHEGTLA